MKKPLLGKDISYYQDKNWYRYIPSDNKFIQAAKSAAIKHSLTSVFPIGIIAVKNNFIIAEAGNGNGYHEKNMNTEGHIKGCVRRYISHQKELVGEEKLTSGEGFELCPGCSTEFHAEANLFRYNKNVDFKDSDIYMFGHFWCCEPCWNKILSAGVSKVYLPEDIDFSKKETVKKWSEEFLSTKNNEN
jgi:deoxycytidylate deaminase